MDEKLQDSVSGISAGQSDDARSVKPVASPESLSPEASSSESGGRGGLDPTRYGDWEIGGKCVDF